MNGSSSWFWIALELGASTLRLATPLLYAALGGLLSERSGVTQIALEGMMLLGAFGAASVAFASHSPWLGWIGGMIFGGLLALVYGIFAIRFRSNQIVAGMAINLLAFGLTPFLSKIFFNSTGSTPSISLAERFQLMPIWMAFALVVLIHLWFRISTSGLWVHFAGEHPEALTSAGVNVRRVRWGAVVLSGILAGMGGASLSIFLSSSFARNMTAGRGFMALAALIFGKWKPIPTAMACLLFGFVEALQIRLQGVIFGGIPVPVQLIQILPYVATVLILTGVMGRSKAPRALGTPLVLLLSVLVFSGCSASQPEREKRGLIPKIISAWKEWKEKQAESEGVHSPDSSELFEAELLRRKHRQGQLLKEMVQVVLQKELNDFDEFTSFQNALVQGASLEGIYNGFTHSAFYRKLEIQNPGALIGAVRIFAEELEILEVELPQRTWFSIQSAFPLAKMMSPVFISDKKKEKNQKNSDGDFSFSHSEAAINHYTRLFYMASLFTLKRVLGDEAMKVVDLKRVNREMLAQWYGKWVVRLAQRKIDFGLELRNKADEAFHYQWAIHATEDLLRWEVLNRLHRLLNVANRKKL